MPAVPKLLPLGALLIAGCATMQGQPKSAKVSSPVINTQGAVIGHVDSWHDAGGSHIALRVRGLPPGQHGMHFHGVGRCDLPDFKSAAGHWNPTDRKHGHLNPNGAHVGDWGNLIVFADKDTTAGDAREGLPSFDDADGTALVIHALPDDERTEPSGNSGDRIACAVLAPPR